MLNEKQINFLAKETKRPKDNFINMTPEKANDVRELCFDIECDEAVACDGAPLSERGNIAVSIVDDLYNGD